MKKCPYCAEEIQDEAVVCKHCGKDLTSPPKQPINPLIATTEKTKKKMPKGCVIVLAVFLVIAILVAIIGISSSSKPVSDLTSANVTYQITGTAKTVFVTYTNADGGTEQYDSNLPFEKTFKMKIGTVAVISAQNKGDTGDVTCTILVDGKEFKTATSSGAYVIASCNGMIN